MGRRVHAAVAVERLWWLIAGHHQPRARTPVLVRHPQRCRRLRAPCVPDAVTGVIGFDSDHAAPSASPVRSRCVRISPTPVPGAPSSRRRGAGDARRELPGARSRDQRARPQESSTPRSDWSDCPRRLQPPSTSTRLCASRKSDDGRGTRLVILNRAIHTGDLFVLPTKALMSLASLAVVAQAVTGLMMWWRRRA